jgi:ribosomal protein S18 acetylase RimI-like enzyme
MRGVSAACRGTSLSAAARWKKRWIQASDILFLTLEGEAIGFAWTRRDAERRGVVEPLGIIPHYQNRGYGRCLLTTAMRILVDRGAQRIEIGAWHNNLQAIELYRSVGFEPVKTITYLAYNLSS